MKDRGAKRVLLVDDSKTSLAIGEAVLSENYRVLTANSAIAMLETLEQSTPDLILLDVEMPGMTGFEAIKILKERPKTRHIPVIFLTGVRDPVNELKGLELGAVDYITKPFSPPLLRKRVDLHLLLETQKAELQNYGDNLQQMVNEKTKTIFRLQNKLLEAMAEMAESRDDTTGNHIARTRHFLRILINAVIDAAIYKDEVLKWNIELLIQSSQLHDIGKIAIRDDILKKPEKLTPEEFTEMQQHAIIGTRFIENLEDSEDDSAFLRYAKIFAESHHEKWDGTGYPYGLAGENIPLLGRLMAIVDVYDALVSVRPYKKAFSHEDAVRIILENRGTHFDPVLVGLFEQVADQFRI